MWTALVDSLGKDVFARIQTCRVLVVGAGGIGCELVKNLANMGFRRVDVLDLDTIDVSNLNRQLLFRPPHVGKAKYIVACQVAMEMMGSGNGDASDNGMSNGASNDDSSNNHSLPLLYKAHHGNVCENSVCNLHFVQEFDLVLNALDNLTARRRVNRLCLAAKVPLVEAGTTGYLGQVNVIDKESGVACYECQTQETPTVYPICTIRSTPSLPVHTIVWAKEFYKLVIGDPVADSMLYEDVQASEPSTYMDAVMELRQAVANKDAVAVKEATYKVIKTIYHDEINKQLAMDRYKAARKQPVTLSLEDCQIGLDPAQTRPPTANGRPMEWMNRIWSNHESISELAMCIQQAMTAETVVPAFDKDDSLSMRFVTAASNLRSALFSIEPLQSFYTAKGIAGNIIPAIATTNAIVAGIQIIQAIRILQTQLETGSKTGHLRDKCLYVNCLQNHTRNGLLLTATRLESPNPQCFVCQKPAPMQLTLHNLSIWTMRDLLERVIKKDLSFDAPTLLLEGGEVIWEEGPDADTESFEMNLSKLLHNLPCGGIHPGSLLQIEDFTQDLTVNLIIGKPEAMQKDDGAGEEEADEYKYTLHKNQESSAATTAAASVAVGNNATGDIPDAASAEAAASGVASLPAANGEGSMQAEDDDDDDIIIVVDNRKRAAIDRSPAKTGDENRDAQEPQTKKQRTAPPSDTEIIEIDDD
jgi:ubiquitin-like 1-activating enzyme E1 B